MGKLRDRCVVLADIWTDVASRLILLGLGTPFNDATGLKSRWQKQIFGPSFAYGKYGVAGSKSVLSYKANFWICFNSPDPFQKANNCLF